MKKKIILITSFLLTFFLSKAQNPQTIYLEPNIAGMQSYSGNANRIFVTSTLTDYVQCTSCTANNITVFSGAGGRKWTILHVDTLNIPSFSIKSRSLFGATSPMTFNSATGVFGMPYASGSTSGYLTSTDWNTFNNKLNSTSIDTGNIANFSIKVKNLFSATGPLQFNASNGVLSILQADSSSYGFLTSTDWTTFDSVILKKNNSDSVSLTGYATQYDILNFSKDTGVVHKAGTETITGFKTINNNLKLGNYSDIILIGNVPALQIDSINRNVMVGNLPNNVPSTGTDNTGIGRFSNGATSGYYNTGLGAYALSSVQTNNGNTAMGYRSQEGIGGIANFNTSVGMNTLTDGVNSSYNTAIGAYAMDGNNVSDSLNVAIGYYAGYKTTGANNTEIGANSKIVNPGYGSNNTILGANIQLSLGNGRIAIGNGDGTIKQFFDGSNWTFYSNITANSFIKSGGTSTQLLLANGATTGLPFVGVSYDTTKKILTMTGLDGTVQTTAIPSSTGGSGSGINTLTPSRVGNSITLTGDNAHTATFNINNADSLTRLDSIRLITPNLLFNGTASYSTASNSGLNTGVVALSLASQSAHVLLGTSVPGTPQWLGAIDSNWVTGLHTVDYYNARYQPLGIDTGNISNYYLKVRNEVSATSPLSYNSSTGVFSIPVATTSVSGYISNTDWTTFNTKLSANQAITVTATGDATGTSTSSGTAPSIALTLTNTAVTPGTYTYASITVDSKGRITSASSNAVGSSITNIGSGYRLITGGNERTLFNGYAINIDSTSNTNGITFKADTSLLLTKLMAANLYLTSIDTSNINSFATKVRGLFSANTPILYVNGKISADTSTAITGLTTLYQNSQKATDNLVVHLAGTETITGYKIINNNLNIKPPYSYMINGVSVLKLDTLNSGLFVMGGNVGVSTGINNTNVGWSGLSSLTSGLSNTNIGYYSLTALTTGNYNTAVGASNQSTIATGNNNTSVGYNALNAITSTASGNTAIGSNAGVIYNGNNNTIIGYHTGQNIGTNNNNTIIGANVNLTSVSNNIAIGTGDGIIRAGFDGTNWNFKGKIYDSAFVTIGGTSSQYVMGDGSLTSALALPNGVTFNNGGAGATSGSSYNGGTAITVSYNTIGASPLAGSSSLTTVGTLVAGAINYSLLVGTVPTWNQNTTGTAAGFTGNLAGDVTGTQSATTVVKINGTSLAGLATGILKNTTGTGVPSIAVAGTDFQTPYTNLTSIGTLANAAGFLYNNGSGTFTYSVIDTTSIANFAAKVRNDISAQSPITYLNGKVGADTSTAITGLATKYQTSLAYTSITQGTDSTYFILNTAGGRADTVKINFTSGNGSGSGTFTPTGAAVTNVSSITPYLCRYIQVGNNVTVSGQVAATNTTSGNIVFTLTLPVSLNIANFPNTQYASGTGTAADLTHNGTIATAITSTNGAQTVTFSGYDALSSYSEVYSFQFTYQVQ